MRTESADARTSMAASVSGGNALSGVNESLLVSWPFLLLSPPGMDFYLHSFPLGTLKGELPRPLHDAIQPIKGRWHQGVIAFKTDDDMDRDNEGDSLESLRRNAEHRLLSTEEWALDTGAISYLDAMDGERAVGEWNDITHEVVVALAAYQIAMNPKFENPFNDKAVAKTRGWGLGDMLGTFVPIEALRLFAVETHAKEGTATERLARYDARRAAPAKAFASKGEAGALPKNAQEFYDRRSA